MQAEHAAFLAKSNGQMTANSAATKSSTANAAYTKGAAAEAGKVLDAKEQGLAVAANKYRVVEAKHAAAVTAAASGDKLLEAAARKKVTLKGNVKVTAKALQEATAALGTARVVVAAAEKALQEAIKMESMGIEKREKAKKAAKAAAWDKNFAGIQAQLEKVSTNYAKFNKQYKGYF